jgi:hypothetical protein
MARTDHLMELREQDLMWAVKRLPRALRYLMLKEGPAIVVAGGYIRACIAGEKVNDVDCFVRSKEEAKKFAEQLSKKPYETDNAFTCRSVGGVTVQFIHRWTYDTPWSIMSSFDFTIAMAGIWFQPATKEEHLDGGITLPATAKTWMSTCHLDFYSDLAAKRLVYTSPDRNEDAGGSILRVLKFYQRGYRIPLDSLGAVVTRLMRGVDFDKIEFMRQENHWLPNEQQLSKVLTGLLREVDPNIDPEHLSHLPSNPDRELRALTEEENDSEQSPSDGEQNG